MRSALPLLLLATSLLCAPVAVALNEYGIEGMGVVSTKTNEGRASLSPDGQRIVFASDRAGGRGGWDLWQATLRDGRWQDAQSMGLNSPADELDPYFSHDGRWLLFASDRDDGLALYRVAVAADGALGEPARLREAGAGTQHSLPERGPALSADGRRLLFARHAGKGRGWDLQVAPMTDGVRGSALALEALNSADDETDGDWLGSDGAVAFTRIAGGAAQVWSSGCAWTGAALQPIALSFNTADGHTTSPVLDSAKPAELLVVSSSARAPRAGGTDVYRMMAPRRVAVAGCGPAHGG